MAACVGAGVGRVLSSNGHIRCAVAGVACCTGHRLCACVCFYFGDREVDGLSRQCFINGHTICASKIMCAVWTVCGRVCAVADIANGLFSRCTCVVVGDAIDIARQTAADNDLALVIGNMT